MIAARALADGLWRAALMVLAASTLAACAVIGPPMPMPHQAHAPLLGGLSLVETPASAPPRDTMVVFFSGDGGWAAIDRGTANALAARGYPVVGVDSLHYYWRGKSREQAGADLQRIVEAYAAAWGKPRVILVGFSFGASTLPTAAGALTPPARERVRAVVMMAPRRYVEFVVRPNSWLDIPGKSAFPFAPTLEGVKTWPLLCLYGQKDKIAACPDLPAGEVKSVALPGGHRFDGNFDHIADLILQAAGEAPASAP
jgi:type IV secretory pathway VirJ component